VPKWKMFRLDRIDHWEPTEEYFYEPPKERGWNAPDYNRSGDGSMPVVYSQVNFDDVPTDTLGRMRYKTAIMKKSKPINISQMDNSKNNPKGPMPTDTQSNTKSLIARNLELTQREKAKRGVDNFGNKLQKPKVQGPIQNNNELNQTKDIETEKIDGPIINDNAPMADNNNAVEVETNAQKTKNGNKLNRFKQPMSLSAFKKQFKR